MPNRTAKFAATIITSIITSAPLTVLHCATPAPAADACLSAPKDQAPAGSHWYYRVEQPSKRHCWYLRDEHDARAQTAPANSAAVAAKPASPQAQNTMPGSVANARAELPSPQARDDQDTTGAIGQAPQAAVAASSRDNAPHGNALDANLLRSSVAARWPEQLGASAAPPVVTYQAAASTPTAAPAAQPASTIPLAAADASPLKPSSSVLTMLAVIVGALSLAGLMGGAIFRFGTRQQPARLEADDDFRPIWLTAPAGRPLPSPFPADDARRPAIGAPRELQAADDPDDRIAAMLARLARSAQN